MAKDTRTAMRALDKQIEGLLDRIVTAQNTSVIVAYEKRIENLGHEKAVLAEKLDQKAKPAHSFTDMFELSLDFIANPWKLWASGQLALQRTVLRLAFADKISGNPPLF